MPYIILESHRKPKFKWSPGLIFIHISGTKESVFRICGAAVIAWLQVYREKLFYACAPKSHYSENHILEKTVC